MSLAKYINLKKLTLFGGGVILYYMLIVFLFNGQKFIFPVFMISAFFFSMFLAKNEFLYSFIPITITWLIQPFLPKTIYSIAIIYIIFTPLTFWLGYYLKKKSWIYKALYPIFIVLVGFYGFSNLWSVTKNINARIAYNSPKIILYSENNTPIRLDTVQGKTFILDFWTTSCSVCFKKFPAYEKIFLAYKNDPSVELYVVNIPTRKDTLGKAKKMIDQYNYKFPKLYAKSDSIPASLGFNRYPHLVFLKNGKIRFNGVLIVDKNVLFHKLKDEIELLLK